MKTIKNLILFLSVCLLVPGLCACTMQKQSPMTIRPTAFSEETDEVLRLFDDEIRFFDLAADESVRSHSFTVWVYQDGAWNNAGSIEGESDFLPERFAVRLTENSFTLYAMDDTGHTEYDFPDLGVSFENVTAFSSEIIDRELPLTLNEETPIWVKTGTDKSSIRVTDITEDFRQTDCIAGIAVTLTVSDQITE